MPDLKNYASYFEELTKKPTLNTEDFKEASKILISMTKDIDEEKLAYLNDNGRTRALGSITSIYSNILNKITESAGLKPPAGQTYEQMKKSSEESLPEQPREYQELFKQLDNFRNKFIENSDKIPQTAKEEALSLNAKYQQQKIAKIALNEVSNMATKVERDMLKPKVEKEGWLDPVNTAQALKFLNDQFDSIEKATKKNTRLSDNDKEAISTKIKETKSSFRDTIIQLSPESKEFISTIDNSNLDIGKLKTKTPEEIKNYVKDSLNNLRTAKKGPELEKAVKEAQLIRYEIKHLKKDKDTSFKNKYSLNNFSIAIREELNKSDNLNINKVQLPQKLRQSSVKTTLGANMATTLAKNMRNRFDKIKTFTTSSLSTPKKPAKSTTKNVISR